MGGVDIGRRRAATPPWPGLVPVRAGLVIDFCTSPIRTGNSSYPPLSSPPLPSYLSPSPPSFLFPVGPHPLNQLKVWGSAVSSPSGVWVWGKAPADKRFAMAALREGGGAGGCTALCPGSWATVMLTINESDGSQQQIVLKMSTMMLSITVSSFLVSRADIR